MEIIVTAIIGILVAASFVYYAYKLKRSRPDALSVEEMESMSKAEIIAYAKAKFDLQLKPYMTKVKMISEIVRAG